MKNSRHPVRDILVRGLLLLLSIVGTLWSLVVLPSSWRSVLAHEISTRIAADDRFKSGVLDEVLSQLRSTAPTTIMRPELPYAEALIAMRVAEDATKLGSSEEADQAMSTAERELRAALVINPTESFFWLMLYSVLVARNGFDQEDIKFLERSYLLGPNEGWIALRRNRLALAVFPMLRDPTQQLVVSEFAGLVDSGFVDDAAMNLTAVGWKYRATLLAGLARTKKISREALAKRLVRENVSIDIPGINALPKARW